MSIAESRPRPAHKSSDLLRVSRRRPCPACGKLDWCLIASDDSAALCMREPSARPARSGGGWWHSFADAPAPHTPQLPRRPAVMTSRASAGHVDRVLRALLGEHLTLSPAHRDSLLARGLSAEEISRNGYASAPRPEIASDVARALSPLGLEGVPGFYFEAGAWRMANLGPGFYVPTLDERGRVSGLQLRRDSGSPKYLWFSSSGRPRGTSSGAPAHFRAVERIREKGGAIITEGALKADVVAHLLGCAVVAVPGVNVFAEDFGLSLKLRLPELRSVHLAYDRDWREKPPVKAALRRLLHSLSRAGISARVRTWPGPSKGLDDYLLSTIGRKGVEAA